MPTKSCTVQYRYLNTESFPPNPSLQQIIVRAMRVAREGGRIGDSARCRIIDLDQDGTYTILNKISMPDSWDGPIFGGQLIHLTEGANVAAVLESLEEDSAEFLLEQVNIGDQARVVDGVLYFAASSNHVGLIENQSLKARTLERYLTAMAQLTNQIEPGQTIILNADFRIADGQALPASSEVTISAEANLGPTAERAARVIEEEAARARREGATVFDVLRTLGWDQPAIEALREDVPDDGWIEGFFKVIIKRRGRRQPISRATINEALRNVEADDLGLRGPGGVEKGGMRKLSATRRVATIGTLIDPEDAMEQIRNALAEWAEQGEIDCDFGDG